ncbi:hypothetical protein BJ944DRAFT_248305 [Cunninghamella echinulata]|nr:hypothetical protein BJ944DRAFT_248305 [Cunninghamella echinulata]
MLQRLELPLLSTSPITNHYYNHHTNNNNNNNDNSNNIKIDQHHHSSFIQNVLTTNRRWQQEETNTINIQQEEQEAYQTEYSSFSSSVTLLTPLESMDQEKFYLPTEPNSYNDTFEDDDSETVYDEEENEVGEVPMNYFIKKEVSPIVKQQRSLLSSMLLHPSFSSSSSSSSSTSSSSCSSTPAFNTPLSSSPPSLFNNNNNNNELSTSLKQCVYWEQLQNNHTFISSTPAPTTTNTFSYGSNSLDNFIGW